MKILYILFVIAFLYLIQSCSDNIEPNPVITDCPLPDYYHDINLSTPPEPHMEQSLSSNGDKLAFLLGFNPSILEILDLKTGLKYAVDIENRLPSNIKLLGIGKSIWCPYDNNRLLIHISTRTDTVGDGKKYVYGQNLYILSLDGSEFIRITPKKFGKAGSSSGFGIGAWLIESSISEDYILIDSIFIPQKEIFLPNKSKWRFISISKDNKNYLTCEWVGVVNGRSVWRYRINDDILKFSEVPELINYVSWSPDSKKFALTITPGDSIINDSSRFREIWFIDVEKFMNEKPDTVPVQIINIRKKFCMYGGIWAEFLTNSTLAVSMCGPHDNFSYLWEITTDGKKVRQLTFEP